MSEEYKSQIAEVPMSESWKQFQGQTVNGEFDLRGYLGGSAYSAAYVTEYDHQPAAIHLISENAPDKEQQLASWQLATEVSHPNLIRVYQVGLCQIGDAKLFYAVMELPEENLAQILAQRALTAEETSAMLAPALDALGYLHKRDLAHRAVNPANIGAIGDQLKLSIDTLGRAGEPIRDAGPYSPPETNSAAAGDVWSLGMTIVETMTQRLPAWQRNAQSDPEVPRNLPEPLLSVVRSCLRRDARRRWTVEEIGEHLNPAGARAKAEAPETKASETVGAPAAESKAGPATADAERPRAEAPSRTAESRQSEQARVPAVAPLPAQSSRYGRVVPASKTSQKRGSWKPALIVLALLAALAGFKLMHRAPNSASQVSAPAETTTENSTESAPPPTENVPPQAQAQQAPAKKPSSSDTRASSGTTAGKPAQSPEAPVAQATGNGVVHQVLPDVPEKAARTVHGKFHVMVKATTNAQGNVTDASLDSAGPSQYFASLALKAARQWKFPAGENAAGDWTIRFDFTSAGTTASATPAAR
jgi:TonB family protein